MDQTLVKIITFCVICFTMIEISEQKTKCYECNTRVDKNCDSISAKTPRKDNCTYCIRIYQKVTGLDDSPTLTSRHCVNWGKKVKNECFKNDLRNSLRSHACVCDKPLCNVAPTARETRLENWVTMLLTLFAAVVGVRF